MASARKAKALWPNLVTCTHILISNLVVKDTERTGEQNFYILLDIKGSCIPQVEPVSTIIVFSYFFYLASISIIFVDYNYYIVLYTVLLH